MDYCFFVSDLHGKTDRYNKLFDEIKRESPQVMFFGGDLLPHAMRRIENIEDFTEDFLIASLRKLKQELGKAYPAIFVILGNDDFRSEEHKFIRAASEGLFHYLCNSKTRYRSFDFFGYPFVPPTPFQIKDWEKYDVSRYVDPGCVHPTSGFRTVDPGEDIEYSTIEKDLKNLAGDDDLSETVFLFHSPPYHSDLDRAALDGKFIDHVPLDVHVGSVAIQRFIEKRQPKVTLHGHIHESTHLTGNWKQQFGRTIAFNASHDGPELSIVKFSLQEPELARRILI
ncbi:MAG: metallophosphoesterase [Bacteroidales bacterium]|nr:metallophosphoesterase [Bacteroidales bacterium]